VLDGLACHGEKDQQMTTTAAEPDQSTGKRPRRWIVPLALLLVWLFVIGPLGSFAGRLAEVQENDNAGFLPESAESTQVLELSAQFSEQDDVAPAIVVYEFEEPIGPTELGQVATDLEAIASLDGVLGDVEGPIPSEDGLAVLSIVPLDAAEGFEVGVFVEGLREFLETETAVTAPHEVFVTGLAGFLSDFGEAFEAIDGLLLAAALLVVLVILLIVYRSPILPLLVLFSSLLALGAASAVVYALASNDIIALNGQSQGILFILVIGATTDYALLIVSRYREELRRRESKYTAIWAALKGTYEAILASGGTVILGVLMFLLSDLASIRGLGPVAAIGVVFAMLSGLTFLPAGLALLGRGAFWPFRPHYGSDLTEVKGAWGSVAKFVGRKHRTVWISVAVGLGALFIFVPSFQADGIEQRDIFTSTTESGEGQEALERHFPAGQGSETIVVGPVEDLQVILDTAESLDGVASAVPTVDAPAGPPEPGAEPPAPLVVDGNVQVEVTLVPPADAPEAEDIVVELRETLDAAAPEALVGGSTAVQYDTLQASDRDLRVILPAVLGVILLVLVLLLRSILAPVLLIGTVVLSFGATIGLGAIFFNNVFDFPGGDPSTPLFAFVFLAALGIDYNIFLMTRAREESIKHGTRPGTLIALAVTGGVITSAGIVLAATFTALAVLPVVFLVQIAFLVAVGVLLDTFIVRSLLVPALVYDIGPKVWWPSKLATAKEDREIDFDHMEEMASSVA
jgi:RND superfamily putative drug exporter